jgi:methionyl-tRNA formyltransferase
MVRVLFLGTNDVGERVYDWLTDRDDATVLALVTERDQLDLAHQLEPDLIVSAGFRHIVPESVLEIPDLGAINLHLSYLPYNKGMNPNVWSIVENAPAGVTMHYMTPGLDEGPIIDRTDVPLYVHDDGKSLYDRLVATQAEQFKRVWESIRDDRVDATDQNPDKGSYHYKEEFVELCELDLEETMRVGDLLNRLRALTFEPFNNAYFYDDGEKYYVNVEIVPHDEAESDGSGNIPSYDV